MRSRPPGRDKNEAKQLMLWIKGLVSIPRCDSLLDLGNGVVWCRLMGKLRPGTLASVLIINRPANVKDAMHNYMLLESAFTKASIPWCFETRKLIAGDSSELLKMARHFLQLRDTSDRQRNAQLQEPTNSQPPLPTLPPPNVARQARCAAGKLPNQQLTSQRSMVKASKVELHENTELTPAVCGELQLKKHVLNLFNNQQVAMRALEAERQPDVSSTQHLVSVPTCFCSKCFAASVS